MFEGVSDAALVAAIEEHTRAEAVAAAARSAAIAELGKRRRVDAEDDERHLWRCDPWQATAAEISAAMGISGYAATKEMCVGLALRDRLPKVAALYAQGTVSSRVISTITWRTRLVSCAAMPQIDTAIAEAMTGWGVLSSERLEQAVDVWVQRFDPAAVIRGRAEARDRDFRIRARTDGAMTATVWGRISPADAELLQQRVDRLVAGVCANDPRTAAQRRSDAAGVLAVYGDRMACLCGDPDCVATAPDARDESIVVHILADEDAASTACDGSLNGNGSLLAPTPAAQPAGPAGEAETPATPAPAARGTAVVVGGGVVPPLLLAELIRRGATIAPIRRPADDPEPHYRPSARLAAFVRMRDLTCRFPGCNRPADRADIDHTTPHPAGTTHPANTKCLCRLHHLLKTFWTGIGGWADRQLADGTTIWTAPTGRQYRTSPGSRLFFPEWNTTTAGLPPPPTGPPPAPSRALKMPKRRRTRAAERRTRIAGERARNEAESTDFEAIPLESETFATRYVITSTDLTGEGFAADDDMSPPF